MKTKSSLKALSEDARYGAFTKEKNTYVRIWGLKRKVGVCSKGEYFFLETYNKYYIIFCLGNI